MDNGTLRLLPKSCGNCVRFGSDEWIENVAGEAKGSTIDCIVTTPTTSTTIITIKYQHHYHHNQIPPPLSSPPPLPPSSSPTPQSRMATTSCAQQATWCASPHLCGIALGLTLRRHHDVYGEMWHSQTHCNTMNTCFRAARCEFSCTSRAVLVIS